jgi:hypothetical protein
MRISILVLLACTLFAESLNGQVRYEVPGKFDFAKIELGGKFPERLTAWL